MVAHCEFYITSVHIYMIYTFFFFDIVTGNEIVTTQIMVGEVEYEREL